MGGKLYNLIMATVPQFYSGNEGEFTIPKDRFLQYTEDDIKEKFISLDQDVIEKLKSLPAIFATEDEVTDARIGKITDIKISSHALRAKYKFDEGRYPLTSGVLKENWQKLGIRESGYEFHRGHWGVKECDLSDFYEGYLKSLTGIAHQLKGADKKVQLIYAFNGTGKTRLSREFRALLTPQSYARDIKDDYTRFLYYNAFTEDLFYWDNDLDSELEPTLKIQPNNYTQWVLQEQGQDQNAIDHFRHYTNDKLMPNFSADFSEVTFSFERGNDEITENVKISKGEESIFIWSIFYSLLEQVINVLNIPEISDRDTDRYDQLEYVFIDDPVTSLDENYLIELAVDVAGLISRAPSSLKFIITTHSPLFYNVLHNELNTKKCYLLEHSDDGLYALIDKQGDSNKSFSYHLYLKQLLESAVAENQIEKYHFMLLRNLYEKTAGFLDYPKWSDLLPGDDESKKAYLKRIIHFSSHSTIASETVAEPTPQEKQTVKLLLDHLRDNYGYYMQQEGEHG